MKNEQAIIQGNNHLTSEPKGKKPFQMPEYLKARRRTEKEYSDKPIEKLIVDTKRQAIISVNVLVRNGDTRPKLLKIGCGLGTPDIPQDDSRNLRVFIEGIFVSLNQKDIEKPIELEVIEDGEKTV